MVGRPAADDLGRGQKLRAAAGQRAALATLGKWDIAEANQHTLTTLMTRVAGMRSLMIVGLIILAILIYFRFRY